MSEWEWLQQMANCSKHGSTTINTFRALIGICSGTGQTCCTAQHSTAQHSTAQHSTAQHSTAQQPNIALSAISHSQCTLNPCVPCYQEQRVPELFHCSCQHHSTSTADGSCGTGCHVTNITCHNADGSAICTLTQCCSTAGHHSKHFVALCVLSLLTFEGQLGSGCDNTVYTKAGWHAFKQCLPLLFPQTSTQSILSRSKL
jgi:hypothetical protein